MIYHWLFILKTGIDIIITMEEKTILIFCFHCRKRKHTFRLEYHGKPGFIEIPYNFRRYCMTPKITELWHLLTCTSTKGLHHLLNVRKNKTSRCKGVSTTFLPVSTHLYNYGSRRSRRLKTVPHRVLETDSEVDPRWSR